MLTKCRKRLVVAGLLMLAAVATPGAMAQTNFMYPGEGTSVTLEIFRPHFDTYMGPDYNIGNSVWFLSGLIPASDRLSVRAEIPIAHSDGHAWDYWGRRYSITETMFGNPYLGVEYATPLPDDNHQIIARFGLRPPVASDDSAEALWVGVRTANDRLECFLPHTISFCGSLGMTGTGIGGTTFQLNLGGVKTVSTDDEDDNQFFLDYDMAFWIPISIFDLGLGGSGRVLLGSDGEIFNDRTLGQLAIVGKFDLGQFKPGFSFRTPIDRYLSNAMPFVVGLNFTYQIR